MKMRVADYLTDALYRAGGETVFLITGGMIMYLTDALLQHKDQKYICCHHEQAAVMAAEAYGRYTGRLGVAYVTAGPAALNTLNGVVGALVDSSPCIIVSGQSKYSQATITGVRQFALQGFNTLPLFSQVTKYAVMLGDIKTVKYEVEKCIYMAQSGRVGPVWIECPIDVQGTVFDPDDYAGFTPPSENEAPKVSDAQLDEIIDLIMAGRRPCILAGAGIRAGHAVSEWHQVIDRLQIPVLVSRMGMDIIDHDHPLLVGRPGTYGDRAANFTVQNCDVLVVIGCRLGIGLVGYGYPDFAARAKKIMIDIDPQELNKPSVVPDLKIHADAKQFLTAFLDRLGQRQHHNPTWIDQTQAWKQKYPVNLPEYAQTTDGINSYHFMTKFTEKLPADALVLVDTGSCFHVHAQATKVKFGQRHIITGGLSTMGYSPAAAGVAAASDRPVYCITGDGSFQFNLQELQTIVHNKLKIKIIMLSNNGYLLIRLTQNNFLGGRHIGTHKETGVSFPDMSRISQAYGLDYMQISSVDELDDKLEELIALDHAVICEVMTPPDQLLQPRVASKILDTGTIVSMPYDHMFPFLSDEEYKANQLFDKT
ncbi:MAG: thiamine pyrophosphate-binding protein [Deltaproteobacteria bacterium]|nr:thiamine pyrophosphate-binding protein [Deltaproteobacteria bacterium]